jgi:hypothetical protein
MYMLSKTTVEFQNVLRRFISEIEKHGMKGGIEGVKQPMIVKITADEEGGLGACKAWLASQHIDLQTFPSERHSVLGVVDRFIRTLRDMNAKQQDKTSDHRDVRDFTTSRLYKLIDEYNNSLHTSTGKTPLEMQTNPDLQKKYIIKKIYEQNRREKISDYDLPVGTWVRFMIPRDFTKKRRFQVSPEVVEIVGKEGKGFVVQAGNQQKTMSRWRLFPVQQNDLHKYKQAKVFW